VEEIVGKVEEATAPKATASDPKAEAEVAVDEPKEN
jgi:hypothetical protein